MPQRIIHRKLMAYRIDGLREYHGQQCVLAEVMLGQPQLVFDGVGFEEGCAEVDGVHLKREKYFLGSGVNLAPQWRRRQQMAGRSAWNAGHWM